MASVGSDEYLTSSKIPTHIWPIGDVEGACLDLGRQLVVQKLHSCDITILVVETGKIATRSIYDLEQEDDEQPG